MNDRRPIPGVGAVVVREESLLLIRRGRGANEGLWAVPGGKVEYGETLREAVARETLEETGYVVFVGDIAWAGEAIGPGDPPDWHYTLIDFYAKVIGGELAAGDDAIAAEWVPLPAVLLRPVTPTMVDLMHVLDRRST
jgi:ADP-ribose pyrophosphatase YjhB (NUDIX family)